jgi:hypothetical protein
MYPPQIYTAVCEMTMSNTIERLENTFTDHLNANIIIYILICGSRVLRILQTYEEAIDMMNTLPEKYLKICLIKQFKISSTDLKNININII